VDVVKPQKVYLFGSYAKKTISETSDVDLLVIISDKTKTKYEIVEEIEKKSGTFYLFQKMQ